jgi:hypothetical protein
MTDPNENVFCGDFGHSLNNFDLPTSLADLSKNRNQSFFKLGLLQ